MIWTNGILGKIAEKGMNKSQFATAMSWSRPTARKKVNGEAVWTVSQIEKACSILGITDKDKYFFANQCSK